MSGLITTVKELARGAFATTYVGIYAESTGIAVKDFGSNIGSPEAISELLFYESHEISAHTLRYVGNAGSQLYLELGVCSLRHFIDLYAPLNEAHARRVFSQLLCCVQYINSKLLLAHRDVKPENFILATDGRFKLADFGCVCSASNKENAMVGTKTYRPEKCEDAISLDVYGLGCCLYELATGKHFCGDCIDPELSSNLQSAVSGLTASNEKQRREYFGEIENEYTESQLCSFEINTHEVFLDLSQKKPNIDAVFQQEITIPALKEKYSEFLMNDEQIIFEAKTQGSLFKKQRLLLITDNCRLVGDEIIDLRTAKVQRGRKRELSVNETALQFESVTDLNNFTYFYFLAKYELQPLEKCYCGKKFRTFCTACRNVVSIAGTVELLTTAHDLELPYAGKLELASRALPEEALNERPEARSPVCDIIVQDDPSHIYVISSPVRIFDSEDISEVSSACDNPTENAADCLCVSVGSD